jgi:excisionase family DNA binding protein
VANVRTREAAALTGKSRTTVWRAIKSGRLSAIRTDNGDFEIEVAELERAFGTLASPDALPSRNTLHTVPLQRDATNNETNVLRIDLATMRERAAALERENVLLREDREQARQERDRLLRIIEEQSSQVRLLTDQRQQAASPTPPWWRRLRHRRRPVGLS